MKIPFVTALCLVALTFTGVALANPGPTSPLYLTGVYGWEGYITVIQGNSVTHIPEAYGGVTSDGLPVEMPIAVWGDIRTVGYQSASPKGGQYSLAGVPTGTSYALPAISADAWDSTSDGTHNYLLSAGNVYQTNRDFSNPVLLFNVDHDLGNQSLGITYDPFNNSLWVSTLYGFDSNSEMLDYSLSGRFLKILSPLGTIASGLALDPADESLWLVDSNTGRLTGFSQNYTFLGYGPYVGYAQGLEFNLGPTPTPEPGTLVLFGSGILGLAGLARRKINL